MAENDLALNWIWTVDMVEDPATYDFQGETWVKTEGYVFIVKNDDDKVRLALACYDDGRVGEVPQGEIDHLLSSWGPTLKKGKHSVWLCPLLTLRR